MNNQNNQIIGYDSQTGQPIYANQNQTLSNTNMYQQLNINQNNNLMKNKKIKWWIPVLFFVVGFLVLLGIFVTTMLIKSQENLASGLYDKNDNLIASWDELVEKYDFKNKIENGGSNSVTGDGAAGAVINQNYLEGTKLVIDSSVTNIGDFAFYNCMGLTSIIIPDSVTSINDYAFMDCTGLKSITIPDSVTSIGNSTFSGCTSLTSITIPDSVTSIGLFVFYGCTSLTSITIPDSVTSIELGAFQGCTSLTSITIPESVTMIDGYVFSDCTSLKNITIPESIEYIGNSTFSECENLTTIYYKGTAEGFPWGAPKATVERNF